MEDNNIEDIDRIIEKMEKKEREKIRSEEMIRKIGENSRKVLEIVEEYKKEKNKYD